MDLRGVLYALAAFAIFATHDAIIKTLGQGYSPIQLIFFSTLFGFPLVTLMLMHDPTRGNLRPVHPVWVGIRTAATVGASLCVFYAFSVLPLAQTYAILFTMPLIITVLAVPMLGERIGWHRSAAVLMGLIGVLVVLRPGTAALSLGHLAALVAATLSALASVIVRRISKDERRVVIMLYPMVANFVLMAAGLAFVYRPMPIADLGLVAAISALAFTAGLFLIAAYSRAEAAIVAPMQYSQIIWASLFGSYLFGERVDWATGLGTAIIIASGLYIVFRESTARAGGRTPVLRTRSRHETTSPFRLSALFERRPRN